MGHQAERRQIESKRGGELEEEAAEERILG